MMMEIINIYVGNQVCQYRKKNKLTQLQLANILKISRTSISNIEMGRHVVTLDKLYIICQLFEINITDILPTKQWVKKNKNKKIVKLIVLGEEK